MCKPITLHNNFNNRNKIGKQNTSKDQARKTHSVPKYFFNPGNIQQCLSQARLFRNIWLLVCIAFMRYEYNPETIKTHLTRF